MSIFVNYVEAIIKISSVLIYAGNIWLFKELRRVSDCAKPQEDYTQSTYGARILSLFESIKKQGFPEKKTFMIFFSYQINSQLLARVLDIRDLGVLFDSELRFDVHVAPTTNAVNVENASLLPETFPTHQSHNLSQDQACRQQIFVNLWCCYLRIGLTVVP